MREIDYSKKSERELTSFMGQELLYDYLCDKLDPGRKAALERLMAKNRELKVELEKIRDGLNYVHSLQKTSVMPELVAQIQTPSTYFHVLLQKTKFRDWSDSVKLAVEGVLIGVGALILIMAIPWSRLLSLRNEFSQNSVVLTEVEKAKFSNPEAEGLVEKPEGDSKAALFEDESKGVAAATQAAKVDLKKEKKETAPVKVEAKAPPVPVAPVKPAAPVQTATTADTAAPDTGKRQGFLLRGTIQVTNVEAVTPKLVEFIDSIGGRKAGEVELGWKKGSGSYFHFTIPEAKQKALMDLFAEYGTLKVSKEPHPRVMPDGIVRYIITVDEKR